MTTSLEQSLCFNVRDFGATGDGQTNDTASIQQAIDACAQSGGGRVVLAHGRFLSATIHLRSHVELRMDSSATLLAHPDVSLYYTDTKTPYVILGKMLVYAEGCEHVAITGTGTIDGQAKLFSPKEEDIRPMLIRLRDCTHARVEGILLKDSASFNLHPVHCKHLRIVGLRINSRLRPNNDGIDVDGCQDVFISDCHISGSDDCIALKTTEHGAPCLDVVISNCILSSHCAAIRIGPDAVANIERVTVTNCIIRDTRLNGIKIQETHGAVMKDFLFSNILMENVQGPISILLKGWKAESIIWAVHEDSNWEQGRLENISFENIRATSPAKEWGISITGTTRTRPRQISFSNIDITFPGGGTAEQARREVPERDREYPEMGLYGDLPAYGLYVRHADDITLNNVRFRLKSSDLRPAIVCDDVTGLELAGFRADVDPKSESLIRLQNTRGAFITGSRPLGPVPAFVQVEGPESREIVLRGNMLDQAGKAVQATSELSPDIVSRKE